MNETEKFFDDLGTDQNNATDILEQPLTDIDNSGTPVEQKIDNEDPEKEPKNRRERRLIKKLQEERESAMFMSGKLAALEETKSVINEERDYLKGVERIYGTESPEAIMAGDLLKKAIIGARDEAEQRAYERIKAERIQEQQELAKAESQLDGFIEEIEETYGVTITEAQERSYFQLLQKMSPKDRNGNVIEYADPHAVWEVFHERVKSKAPDNTAKILSNRSMTQSGASLESSLPDGANIS